VIPNKEDTRFTSHLLREITWLERCDEQQIVLYRNYIKYIAQNYNSVLFHEKVFCKTQEVIAMKGNERDLKWWFYFKYH